MTRRNSGPTIIIKKAQLEETAVTIEGVPGSPLVVARFDIDIRRIPACPCPWCGTGKGRRQ